MGNSLHHARNLHHWTYRRRIPIQRTHPRIYNSHNGKKLTKEEASLIKPDLKPTAHEPANEIEKLICSKDWNCQTAIAIAKAESGLRCNATNKNTNKSIDSGLYQINSIHKQKYEGKNIYDCKTNIEIAYQIYKAQGWNPWVAFSKGRHLKFIN